MLFEFELRKLRIRSRVHDQHVGHYDRLFIELVEGVASSGT